MSISLRTKSFMFLCLLLCGEIIARNGGQPLARILLVPLFFVILFWPKSTEYSETKILSEFMIQAIIGSLFLISYYIIKHYYCQFFSIPSSSALPRDEVFAQTVLYSGIVAPLVEEFRFRYCIFTNFKKLYAAIPRSIFKSMKELLAFAKARLYYPNRLGQMPIASSEYWKQLNYLASRYDLLLIEMLDDKKYQFDLFRYLSFDLKRSEINFDGSCPRCKNKTRQWFMHDDYTRRNSIVMECPVCGPSFNGPAHFYPKTEDYSINAAGDRLQCHIDFQPEIFQSNPLSSGVQVFVSITDKSRGGQSGSSWMEIDKEGKNIEVNLDCEILPAASPELHAIKIIVARWPCLSFLRRRVVHDTHSKNS